MDDWLKIERDEVGLTVEIGPMLMAVLWFVAGVVLASLIWWGAS